MARSTYYRHKSVSALVVSAVPNWKPTSKRTTRAGTQTSELASCNAAAVALPARRPNDPRSNASQPVPAARA